jgi:hypothetical protein
MDEPKKRGGSLRHFVIAMTGALLALPVAYGAAYWAIVDQPEIVAFSCSLASPTTPTIEPSYGSALRWLEADAPSNFHVEREKQLTRFFTPAHAIDRFLRPKYWGVKP